MTLALITYFFAGLLQDVLWTFNIQAVSKNKVLQASFFSFATTVMGMFVLYDIIADLDSSSGKIAILVYALGIATGTIVAMHLESYLARRHKMGKKADLVEAKKEAELGISPLL